MPKEIKEDIAEDIKEEFLKLLRSLQAGMPKDNQAQMDSLLKAVKNHDLPEDIRTHLTLVLTILICGAPHGLPQIMIDKNKELIEAFSKKYLNEPKKLKKAAAEKTEQEITQTTSSRKRSK